MNLFKMLIFYFVNLIYLFSHIKFDFNKLKTKGCFKQLKLLISSILHFNKASLSSSKPRLALNTSWDESCSF